MALDRRHVGHVFAPFTVPVEAGRLRFFAKATGQAPDPDGTVPPTFLFCLEMDGPDPGAMRELLGMDYRKLLHGEQHFEYHRPAHAGDVLRFQQRVADIYEKKGGLLEFAVRETSVHNQRGEHVADLRCVSVLRHG